MSPSNCTCKAFAFDICEKEGHKICRADWPGCCALRGSLPKALRDVSPRACNDGAQYVQTAQLSQNAFVSHIDPAGPCRLWIPPNSVKPCLFGKCLTSSTLCAVRADVSKKMSPCSLANASPSSVVTARRCCTRTKIPTLQASENTANINNNWQRKCIQGDDSLQGA